jgi:predicted regulator of Ras-like GTPase activity (Roadblock/LC7/MglB family)
VVAEAAPLDDRQRLIGIYQGIVLAAARRVLRPLGAGEIHYLLTRYEAGTVIVRPLRDGYYVVLSLRPGSDLAVALRRSAGAQVRMNQEMS